MCFFKDFIYLFLERVDGREKERKRNINVWLTFSRPQLETWPAIQACAMIGNQTGNPLVRRLALNPLNHTSQGCRECFESKCIFLFKIYLFLERGREGSEREGEKHQCVVASHEPPIGDLPTTQACALTGNRTCNLLVCRPVLNPLSYTSQAENKCILT